MFSTTIAGAESSVAPATYLILPGEPLPKGGADEVGNKAWNLLRMTGAGLPVPPAFVLSTQWCKLAREGRLDEESLRRALRAGIARLETATGLSFGAARRPLLVSVRSGAAISMPGMLETILDVGLNLQSVEGLIRLTGNPRLAWDSLCRLVEGYASVVAALPAAQFDALAEAALAAAGARNTRELDHRALRELAHAYDEMYRSLTHTAFPADPHEQLFQAARAVLRSWDAPKALKYRELHGLAEDAGTAVTVQAMVYGNAGALSGAGVAFTRNPATGTRELYFDFVFNGQGEDVVAGRHNPENGERLHRLLPAVWAQLEELRHGLERLFHDVQDFEFTIEGGRLFLLQTRRAQRTPWAALQIAVDLVGEGVISPAEGLSLLNGLDLERIARARFVPPLPPALAHATVAGVGVAAGTVALDAAAAARYAAEGKKVVLVRREMVTEDIAAIEQAEGVLTATGGRTAHAAVVARSMGKLCLVGCGALAIDLVRRTARIGEREVREGEELSLDGGDGAIYAGRLETELERPERALAAVAGWRAHL